MIREQVELEQIGCQLIDDIIESYEVILTDEKNVSTILTELLAYQTGANPIVFGIVDAILDEFKAIKIEWKNIWEACLAVRDLTGGILGIEIDSVDPLIRKLYLRETMGDDVGQQIRYKKNLMGIERNIDYRGLVTKLYPIGNSNLVLSSALIEKEVATKSSDVTYGYLTLGGLYSSYKNWTGAGDALPAGMQVFELGYGWFSPTGYVDGGGVWSDEVNAYDGILATYTWLYLAADSWSDFIEFTHAVRSCTKIRWLSTAFDPDIKLVDVDIFYTGLWHHLYNGAPLNGTWMQEIFGAEDLEAIRIRFYRQPSTQYWGIALVNEVQFYGTGGVVDVTANWKQGADKRTIRCAIADYDPAKTYGITYYHNNYLLAWDMIGTYGTISGAASFDAGTVDQLIAMGRVWLTEIKQPRIEYAIKAVDISALPGFEFDKLKLGSRIKVIDEDLGVDVDVNIVRLNKPDLDDPLNLQIELANKVKDVSDVLKNL